MEYRELNGQKISLLGFGSMRLPLNSETVTDIDRKTALKMVDEAYRNGVNYFDTAYPYHEGESERFVGEALQRYPRESFYLADKMPTWLIGSVADGERIFQEQLDKCRVKYFDFYLCHAVGQTADDFEKAYLKTGLLDVLKAYKAQGKIRNLGFSFHGSPERLEEILKASDWDFVQLQINYLDWTLQQAQRQYRLAEQYRLPVIVMEPVRGGALHSLCPEAEQILKQASPNSCASWAMRYAASLPNVLTVLSGMTKPEHVADNLQTFASFRPLSDEEKAVVEKAKEAYLKTGFVPCTGCRYCMDCPFGVDIPEVFRVYNKCASTLSLPLSFHSHRFIDKDANRFVAEYEKIPAQKRADRCRSCNRCTRHCPQHIDIPQKMQEIAEIYRDVTQKDE